MSRFLTDEIPPEAFTLQIVWDKQVPISHGKILRGRRENRAPAKTGESCAGPLKMQLTNI
jgi:hypothetical protein